MVGTEDAFKNALWDGRLKSAKQISKETGIPIYLVNKTGKDLAKAGLVRDYASEQVEGAPLYELIT